MGGENLLDRQVGQHPGKHFLHLRIPSNRIPLGQEYFKDSSVD